MAKALVEVEIPDGWELAEPRMRVPQHGEFWLNRPFRMVRVNVCTECGGHSEPSARRAAKAMSIAIEGTKHEQVIVNPAWQWPAWLKAPWITKDESGEWWAFWQEPEIDDIEDQWISERSEYAEEGFICGETCECIYYLDGTSLFDFTPPPCTDWRQSKRRNPNL
jgi:hypothetical protein